jgi:hypothetical protein
VDFSLEDMFVAYRKAKTEAFWDDNLANGFKFAAYEDQLVENLDRLRGVINAADRSYWTDVRHIGGVLSIPRKPPVQYLAMEPWHFMEGDPLLQWSRSENPSHPTLMPFRDIIDPTIDVQILSALWIIHPGAALDLGLLRANVFANRVDRNKHGSQEVKVESHRLFKSYVEQYKKWQNNGYEAISNQLNAGAEVLVFHLDVRDFFNQVDASLVLELVQDSAPDWEALTLLLLQAIDTWNADVRGVRTGLPVGLSASGVIANLLLAPLDQSFAKAANVYYGRYVDDMFLVCKVEDPPASGESAMQWLAERVPQLRITGDPVPEEALLIELENNTTLRLSAGKTSIKHLAGPSGIEMLHALMEEQAARASEQRLRPPLPSDPIELGRRALILRDGDKEQVHHLRAARSVELKRAAFAQVLRLMEQYDRDLNPKDWEQIRHDFYGIIIRHALTPNGLFTYHKRLAWVVALMVSCEDFSSLQQLLDRLSELRELLHPEDPVAAARFWFGLCCQMAEAAIGAARTGEFESIPSLLETMAQSTASQLQLPVMTLQDAHEALVRTDWALRTYGDHWLSGRVPALAGPGLPPGAIADVVERFRDLAALSACDWRPIWFPTRPISAFAITSRIPQTELPELPKYLRAFRGHATTSLPIAVASEEGQLLTIRVGHAGLFGRLENPHSAVIAVASVETTESDLNSSLATPVPTDYSRYKRLREILTATLRSRGQVDYLVLPELSLPRRWAEGFVGQLTASRISLLAGLEYEVVGQDVKNQALYALASDSVPGATVAFLRDKSAPAWTEEEMLQGRSGTFNFVPGHPESIVVQHDGFCFSVMICSDLTNLDMRAQLRGAIDALFVLEWNRDVDGFGHIVAASSTDLHAYIVQVNNRQFGDSWIRGPFCESYQRDILKVKGGREDFVLTGEINFRELRDFQNKRPGMSCEQQKKDEHKYRFKPVPIGFKPSEARRIKSLREELFGKARPNSTPIPNEDEVEI